MTITCPHCHFSRDIDATLIPAGTVRVACPRCKEKFSFSRTETAVPSAIEPTAVPPAAIGVAVAPAGGAEHLPKAGFWLRFAASIVDSLLVWVVQSIVGFALGFAAGSAGGGLDEGGGLALFGVVWLFSVLIAVAYYVTFTGYSGQTPGKMVVRIKVVRTDGSDIGYGTAALRETIGKFISGILLGIGYLMVAFDAQKQGLHDKIANTYVVKV